MWAIPLVVIGVLGIGGALLVRGSEGAALARESR
jgi:hypothetical protein